MIDSYGKYILCMIKQKVEQGLFIAGMNEIARCKIGPLTNTMTLIRHLPPSTRTAGFDAIIFGLRISQEMGR